MIVVLHLIALAMVAAGMAAISFGSGIISLERGWTMVISGTVVTSAGIVVLGIAAILVRLNGLADELAHMRGEATRRDAQRPTPPERLLPAEPAIIAPPVVFDDVPVDPPRIDPQTAEPVDIRPKRPWARPPRVETRSPPPDDAPPPPPAESLREPVLSAVPLMTAPDALDPIVEPRHANGEASLAPREPSAPGDPAPELAPPESGTEPDPAPVPNGATPDPEPLPPVIPEPDEPTASFPEVEAIDGQPSAALAAPPDATVMANGLDAPAEADADEPEVVGSYSSGDNSYVMYVDGSIKAQTPTGRYRFGSLDELKRFLSGESGPASAPIAKA